jgi:Secretion system C-terminal sorting domain
LIINHLQISDEGIYTCKVTNPTMPLLTLYSRKINLIVHTGACSDSARLLTARQRAMNWGWNPNWQLQSPYLSWTGVHYANGCADSVYIRRDSILCGALGASFQLSVPNNNNLTNATYRWYRNGIWIGTTPNASFTLFNLNQTDFAKYNVVVEQVGYLPLRLDLGTIQSCCTETRIAPNPTLDFTKIYCGGKLGEMVQIYNELGQLIHTQVAAQEPLQLDLSAFQNGVYFVRWDD